SEMLFTEPDPVESDLLAPLSLSRFLPLLQHVSATSAQGKDRPGLAARKDRTATLRIRNTRRLRRRAPRAAAHGIAPDVVDPIASFASGNVYAGSITPRDPL